MNYKGAVACDRDGECYLNFGKVAGLGVPGKISVGIVGTDYENWAVLYVCKQHKLRFKNEHIWILSREPIISPEHYQAAKRSVLKFSDQIDVNRFVPVTQDSKKCEYSEF